MSLTFSMLVIMMITCLVSTESDLLNTCNKVLTRKSFNLNFTLSMRIGKLLTNESHLTLTYTWNKEDNQCLSSPKDSQLTLKYTCNKGGNEYRVTGDPHLSLTYSSYILVIKVTTCTQSDLNSGSGKAWTLQGRAKADPTSFCRMSPRGPEALGGWLEYGS